jgi:lysophospholipase L1-like esterase
MGYQLVGVGASILWTGGWPRPVMAVGDSITWTARGPLRDVVDAKVVARDATRLTDPWFPADVHAAVDCCQPAVVVLNIGVNDAWPLQGPTVDPETWIAAHQALVAGLDVEIIPVTLTQRSLVAAINALTPSYNTYLRDSFPTVVDWDAALVGNVAAYTLDSLHPSEQGSTVLAGLYQAALDP